MKIIKTKWFPFSSYTAINIFGVIFAKVTPNNITLNHESIHTAQMKEMLYIFFYLWYIIEFIIIRVLNLFKSNKECYYQLSFEQEAYDNQYNLDYLKNRRHYVWLKYINILIK